MRSMREVDGLADLPLRDYAPRSCLRAPSHIVPKASFPAIDAHNHLGKWLSPAGEWTVPDVGSLLELMDSCNVRAIVNLDGRWGQELEDNLDRYDRAHDGRFITFCQLDWRETAAAGFGDRLRLGLERSTQQGARGVKVWKDLGLHICDEAGDLVMPDDHRLSDLWETAADLHLPVLIHTADPVAFFSPMDRYNERLEELLENPDWSFFDDRFPPFAALIESFEGLVAAHPRTIFIGAHVGCYAEDLEWVGRMLDTYPNFHIDIAARLAELGRQPQAARRLFMEHSDRVLFGSDIFPPSADDYAIHFRFLETGDEHFDYSTEEVPPQGRWKISGLNLPPDVARAIYTDNASRLLLAGGTGALEVSGALSS
jgi:predicted TIM-barrel fold metal-dependent hydrolase